MKSANFSALVVGGGGFLWVASGLDHSGLEQTLRLGIGVVMLSIAVVLLELGKWARL